LQFWDGFFFKNWKKQFWKCWKMEQKILERKIGLEKMG
jgi:hypothetical protein